MLINLLNINTEERYNEFHNYCKCLHNETVKENNIEQIINEIISFFGSNENDFNYLLYLKNMENYIMAVVNKELFEDIINKINPVNKFNRAEQILNLISKNNVISSEGFICICRLLIYKTYAESL